MGAMVRLMTVAEIIDTLGGPTALSNSLGLPSTTVSNWRIRQSIPARYHQALLSIADGKVTAAQIVAAHAHEVAELRAVG
jgi:DNA-binding transcriptional regulator YdaS (Cro superfamily)